MALLVASPWYLKSWLWLGSPFFPLFTEAEEWTRYYLTTAGTPKTPLGLLTLPLALFFPPNEWTFSAAIPHYFFLSYLFLALPTVLLAPRNSYVRYLTLFGALFFAVWAQGYQLVRFLYPAFPVFSLLVAHGLVEGRWRMHLGPTGRRLPLAVFLSVSLALQLALLASANPLAVLTGRESRDSFLANSPAVWSYQAVRWANDHLPDESRLYMVGSGQGYFSRHALLPDSTLGNMNRLFSKGANAQEALRRLHEEGFTHLFLSDGDVRWHLLYRDPEGRMRWQMGALQELLRMRATLLYQDENVRVFRLDYGEISTE